MDRCSPNHKHLHSQLALFQFHQRNIEFHPSSPFSMHWPPLTTRFLTNAFAFVTPSHVFPISGGGGGRGGRGGRGASSVKRNTPPSSTNNSSRRRNFANSTVGTRSSPRLREQQQRQNLATPRVLMDTIAESPPSHQSSPNLLAITQQASRRAVLCTALNSLPAI
jgi:hypothetical protein